MDGEEGAAEEGGGQAGDEKEKTRQGVMDAVDPPAEGKADKSEEEEERRKTQEMKKEVRAGAGRA